MQLGRGKLIQHHELLDMKFQLSSQSEYFNKGSSLGWRSCDSSGLLYWRSWYVTVEPKPKRSVGVLHSTIRDVY